MKGLRAEEPRSHESALRRPSSFTDRAESFPISQILIFISINGHIHQRLIDDAQTAYKYHMMHVRCFIQRG